MVCVSAQARIPPTGSQVPDWMQHSRVDVSIQDQIKDQIPSIGGVELSSESEEEDEGGAAAPQKRWKPPKAGVRHGPPLLSYHHLCQATDQTRTACLCVLMYVGGDESGADQGDGGTRKAPSREESRGGRPGRLGAWAPVLATPWRVVNSRNPESVQWPRHSHALSVCSVRPAARVSAALRSRAPRRQRRQPSAAARCAQRGA